VSIQREYNIVKSNELIQKARFNLSVQEQKIVLYLISKIKPTDKQFQVYKFRITEFCKVCGIEYESGKNYKNVRDSIDNLADKKAWILLDNGKTSRVSWINKAWIAGNEQNGRLEIRLDEDLLPYLIELHNNFTQYGLKYILSMKSQYSIRLYELLKSYQNLNNIIFEIDKLKQLLMCENYKRFPDFKRKVIDIAMREINKLTDITIEFTPIKSGKRFAQINFAIKNNKKY